MAYLITALIAIAVIMGGSLLLTDASLMSASDASLSWDGRVRRTGEQKRTHLTLIQADLAGGGTDVDISFRNTGQSALAEFSGWDLIIRYYAASGNNDMKVLWLPHTTVADPPNGKWIDRGIYHDAVTLDSEVYEPNFFNPGEEIIIRVNITPEIPSGTDNLVTIGTANGARLSAPFSR